MTSSLHTIRHTIRHRTRLVADILRSVQVNCVLLRSSPMWRIPALSSRVSRARTLRSLRILLSSMALSVPLLAPVLAEAQSGASRRPVALRPAETLSVDEAFVAARAAMAGEQATRFDQMAARAAEHPLSEYVRYWGELHAESPALKVAAGDEPVRYRRMAPTNSIYAYYSPSIQYVYLLIQTLFGQPPTEQRVVLALRNSFDRSAGMDLFDMAGHLIRRLHQQSVQVFVQRTQAAGFDLTPVQFAALDAIHANPATDQARVAEFIGYDRATIGGVIDRLEQKGWVRRVVSERDRRSRQLSLTPAGKRVRSSLLPIVTDLQEEILLSLGHSDRERFLRLARQALRL